MKSASDEGVTQAHTGVTGIGEARHTIRGREFGVHRWFVQWHPYNFEFDRIEGQKATRPHVAYTSVILDRRTNAKVGSRDVVRRIEAVGLAPHHNLLAHPQLNRPHVGA